MFIYNIRVAKWMMTRDTPMTLDTSIYFKGMSFSMGIKYPRIQTINHIELCHTMPLSILKLGFSAHVVFQSILTSDLCQRKPGFESFGTETTESSHDLHDLDFTDTRCVNCIDIVLNKYLHTDVHVSKLS